MTYAPGRSCIPSYRDTLSVIDRSTGRVTVALTRPRFRVSTNARWAEKITRKYRVASSAIVLKIVGNLSTFFSDFAAKTTINKNARESNNAHFLQGQHYPVYIPDNITHHRRGRCSYKRPLAICADKIHIGGTHRGVSAEVARLQRRQRRLQGVPYINPGTYHP